MTLERRALIDAIALLHEREPFSGVIYVRERREPELREVVPLR